MRFVTFRRKDGPSHPGLLEDDAVRTIATSTLLEYVALAPHERIAWHTSDEAIPLSEVTLDAPVRPSRNIFCVGRNYLEHAKEGARASGRELKLPDVPTFFTKAPTAIAGPGATLHLDGRISNEYDFEAELAVVIGARCKDVAEADAMHVVFGYTCLNDVTARDLQRAHVQWFKGKSLDDCCPLGPWIVSADEFGDPHEREISLRLNGETKQHSSTSQMIFRIPRLIAELSKGMTLEPGRRHRDGNAGRRRIRSHAARISCRRRRDGGRHRRNRRTPERNFSAPGLSDVARNAPRMIVAVPRETAQNERRVALVPETVQKLTKSGIEVRVQRGAGTGAAFPDELYQQAGASFADDPASLVAAADVLVGVGRPSDAVLASARRGATVIGFLNPLGDPGYLRTSRRPGYRRSRWR